MPGLREGDLVQTRFQSLIESWVNIIVGYGMALLAQMTVFPLLGIPVRLDQNILIGLIFTAVSLARSYTLRRIFNRWHR